MTDAAASSPPQARLASTVLLLRDGATGLEVFMVVRHHEIDFASGALVFPGGSIEPGDGLIAGDTVLCPPLPGLVSPAPSEAEDLACVRTRTN